MEKIKKLAELMSAADKLAKELIAEDSQKENECRVIGAHISDGYMSVQIYKNLKALSDKMGVPIVRTYRDGDNEFPYEDSIDVDGVKFFEILTKREAETA